VTVVVFHKNSITVQKTDQRMLRHAQFLRLCRG
jgi:hypothetical protein